MFIFISILRTWSSYYYHLRSTGKSLPLSQKLLSITNWVFDGCLITNDEKNDESNKNSSERLHTCPFKKTFKSNASSREGVFILFSDRNESILNYYKENVDTGHFCGGSRSKETRPILRKRVPLMITQILTQINISILFSSSTKASSCFLLPYHVLEFILGGQSLEINKFKK